MQQPQRNQKHAHAQKHTRRGKSALRKKPLRTSTQPALSVRLLLLLGLWQTVACAVVQEAVDSFVVQLC